MQVKDLHIMKGALRSVLIVLLLSMMGLTKAYALNITFADTLVKQICVYHWDTNGDSELSYTEAAAVTSLGQAFSGQNITSFDELQYFTNLSIIDNYAFSSCQYLSSVNMGNSVIGINRNAFEHCTGLVSINFPNSLVTISSSAFAYCTNLVSINFPNSLVTIGEGAFFGCTSLSSLNIPNSVETICQGAFSDCTSLTSVFIPESVVLFGVYQALNYYGNYSWYTGSNVFSGCSNLNSIVVDENNPAYDSRQNCNAVIVKSNNALISGCNNSFIPSGVSFIGKNAFRGCARLASITIPSSVIGIGDATHENYYGNPFEGCSGLNSIFVASDNPKFDSRNNCNAIIVKDFNWLLTGCKNTVIPNSVTEISGDAFYDCTSLTSIEIPNSVTTISVGAFTNCTGLSSMEIPNSVTSIGEYAFWGCSGLTSLTIGSSVASIGSYAFGGCSNLASMLVLAETPPALSYYVFDNVPTEIPVEVPCGTLSAYQSASGWNAFTDIEEDCTTTFTITTSANPTEGGTISGGGTYLQSATCTLTATANFGYSFVNWTENGSEVSTDASYSFTVTEDRTLVANFEENSIIFADANVKDICVANWDTNGDGELSYVEAAAVTTLGTVFKNNQTITSFNELQYFTGLTIIKGHDTERGSMVTPNGAFYNCNNLTSIIIPENVTTIGGNAFTFCKKLASINLPSAVTIINDYAFTYCYALATIEVYAETPPTLGNGVFNSVNKTIPVYVPCGTASAYQAANGWSQFTNIQERECLNYEITASVNPMEGGTVTGNGIYIQGTTCTLTATANDGYIFMNWTENGSVVSTDTIYSFIVTGARTLLANFEQETIDENITFADTVVKTLCVANWDTNGDGELSYAEAAAVTDIGMTFRNNNTITSFEELQYFTGLVSIVNGAFQYCGSLSSIIIPNSVISVGDHAFDRCYNLVSITLGNFVTSIGDHAFYYCSNLPSFTFGNSVISIGGYVFCYCYNLSSVSIGSSVNSIGTCAFAHCLELEQITVNVGNSVYDSRESCNAIIETASNTLIAGCKNTVIPNSVVSIGRNAFFYCSSLTSISIPSSVTSIGTDVFNGCGLEQITVDTENTVYDSRENCNAIIETASNTLMVGCSNTIIPNSVITIGIGAFYDRDNLTAIAIPNSVTSIGLSAFEQCNNLVSVIIGNSMSSIEDRAFYNCNGIDSMTMFVETPSALGNYVFYNVNKTIPVYVPVGTMATYQAASGWNEFTNYQEIETIITQTINFNQGSNWFSSNVEITLDDLKAALLSALNNASGIKITSQSNGYTIWNGSFWRGSLNPFEVSQMYVIDVPSACEITLEAIPINPAAQPITIFPGFNWIGFLLDASISIEDAFAGFAVSGDKVSFKSQNAVYTGIRWEGTLNTLVPGQGYMFESSQTGNRTFIFPSGR